MFDFFIAILEKCLVKLCRKWPGMHFIKIKSNEIERLGYKNQNQVLRIYTMQFQQSLRLSKPSLQN